MGCTDFVLISQNDFIDCICVSVQRLKEMKDNIYRPRNKKKKIREKKRYGKNERKKEKKT